MPWYFSMYLHTCVPIYIIVAIIVGSVIAIILRWRLRYEILLSTYLLFIICHAVLFRSPSSEVRAILMPFWNYRVAFGNWDLEELGEIVMNMVLFVPVGLIGAFKYKWHQVLYIGCGFSVFIEFLQFLLHRGLCETDDVVHNTLGTLIGYGVVKAILGLYKCENRFWRGCFLRLYE